MKKYWLAFLSIGFLTILTFIFFVLRLQPVQMPTFDDELSLNDITEPIVTFVNPSIGPQDARVTLVTYGDFQCTACKELATSLEIAQKTFPNDVKIVWKNFPNESLHHQATPAAIAALCADRQEKFWPYHTMLFERQTQLSEIQYETIAEELELDISRFKSCIKNQDTLAIVQKDFEEALALDLSAAPTLYINNQPFQGAISAEEILSRTQALLKQ